MTIYQVYYGPTIKLDVQRVKTVCGSLQENFSDLKLVLSMKMRSRDVTEAPLGMSVN